MERTSFTKDELMFMFEEHPESAVDDGIFFPDHADWDIFTVTPNTHDVADGTWCEEYIFENLTTQKMYSTIICSDTLDGMDLDSNIFEIEEVVPYARVEMGYCSPDDLATNEAIFREEVDNVLMNVF